MIDYYETKEHPITKNIVLEAYKKVKANDGSAGIDQQSLESYEKDLKGNPVYNGQKQLLWDGENMRITNFEPANQFVKRNYRGNWKLEL